MKKCLMILGIVATAACLGAELSADFAVEKGRVRRELHSSGYAPMIAGFGNLPAEIKSLNFHSVRTHDLALVNAGQRVVDVKNAGLIVSAKVLDHERNFVPAHMTIKDGRLTLKKEMEGSAAFLVTFDLSAR